MPATPKVIGVVTLGTTTLPLYSSRFATQLRKQLWRHSGIPHPSQVSVLGAAPRYSLTVPVKAALDLLAFGVVKLTAWAFYLRSVTDATVDALAAATADKYSGSFAFAYIETINLQQGAFATATVRVVAMSSDGFTAPAALTTAQTMPAVTAGTTARSTIAPVKVNGTVQGGAQSTTLTTGERLDVQINDGELYPRVAVEVETEPVITSRILSPTATFNLAGLTGVAITSATAVFIRDVSDSAMVPQATGLSIAIANGLVTLEEMPAEQGRVTEAQLTITGFSAAGAHPWVYATGQAIPAA